MSKLIKHVREAPKNVSPSRVFSCISWCLLVIFTMYIKPSTSASCNSSTSHVCPLYIYIVYIDYSPLILGLCSPK